MPRDSSGNFALTGSAFVAGQTADATAVNAKLNDIATELTDSLSRSGKGGMTQPFRTLDGSVSGPGLAFTQETGTGFYRVSAGVLGLAILGAQVARASASGLHALAYGVLTATSAILRGAVADGASAVGVILDNSITLATSTAKLLSVRNNGSEQFYVSVNGALAKPSGTLQARGEVADGASAVGVELDNSVALTTSGAKLLSVKNATVEKAFIDKDGSLAVDTGYYTKAGTGGTTTVAGTVADGATAVGARLDNLVALTTAGAKIASFANAGVEKAYVDKDGRINIATPVGANDAATKGYVDSLTDIDEGTITASWTVDSATRVWKTNDGQVILNLWVVSPAGTTTTTVATLPVGVRPPTGMMTTLVRFTAGGTYEFVAANVATSGAITVTSGAYDASKGYSLNITYKAA